MAKGAAGASPPSRHTRPLVGSGCWDWPKAGPCATVATKMKRRARSERMEAFTGLRPGGPDIKRNELLSASLPHRHRQCSIPAQKVGDPGLSHDIMPLSVCTLGDKKRRFVGSISSELNWLR